MTDVDWDLLADHLGGALDGTPEQARVARLIATDPAWSRAAAQLAAALDAVSADLAALPSPGRMPAEVEARLTEALVGAPPAGPPADGPAPAGPPTEVGRAPAASAPTAGAPPGARPATTRPGPAGPGPAGPAAGRPPRRPAARRRARWIGAGTVLAGLAAFAAGALGLGLVGGGPLGLSGADGAGGAPEAAVDADQLDAATLGAEEAEQPYLAAPRDDALKLATGTDYGPRTVSDPPVVGQNADDQGSDMTATAERSADVPPELAVLWRNPTPCLDAVAAGLPSPPLAFERLDFAYFAGEPAVMIWVTAADGARWVVAAGSDCGSDPTDADTRYQRQLK